MSSTNEQLRWIFNYNTCVCRMMVVVDDTYVNSRVSHLIASIIWIKFSSLFVTQKKIFGVIRTFIAMHSGVTFISTLIVLTLSQKWMGIEAFNFRFAFDDWDVEWKENSMFAAKKNYFTCHAIPCAAYLSEYASRQNSTRNFHNFST